MSGKEKPNFKPFNNKRSGPQGGDKPKQQQSQNFNKPRDHHDSLKGGGGNSNAGQKK